MGQKWTQHHEWRGKAAFVPSLWSEDEFNCHLDSGRITWRECPGTAGVYEYKDTQFMSMEQSVNKTKTMRGKQNTDFNAESNQHIEFMDQWNSINGMNSSSLGETPWGGKGIDNGQSKGKGKGKGKGKPKDLLAIENGPLGDDDVEKKMSKKLKMVATVSHGLQTKIEAAMYNQGKKLSKTTKKVLEALRKRAVEKNMAAKSLGGKDSVKMEDADGLLMDLKTLRKDFEQAL